MIYVYSLRNRKGSFYLQPYSMKGSKEDYKTDMIRSIKIDPVTAKKNFFDECELYCLGEFDDLQGHLKVYEQPEFLLDLGEFLKNVEQNS